MVAKPIEKKPEWYHKHFAYDLAKWIFENRIVKIEHSWKMTSADTAEYWATLIADDKTTRKIAGWHHFLKLTASHKGLVELDLSVERDVRKILDWEKAHKSKIAEFQKLKQELGL